jgi:phage protein U
MAQVGSLGDIVFQTSADLVRTFGEYGDSVSARLGTHEVGGSDPVLEFVGPGVRSIDLSVQLAKSLGIDVEMEISRTQEYCRAGKLLALVLGGRPVGGAAGRWMIDTVEASRQHFDSAGRAIVADLKLSLKLARTASTPAAISTTIIKKNTTKVKS